MTDDLTPPAGEPSPTPPAPPPEPLTAPEPSPEPPAEGQGPDDLEPRADDPPELARVRREAARHRTNLRTVESERDQLRERLDGMERERAEGVAAQLGMATPADLWLLVSDLDELRADGALDVERTRERVQTILRERPSWRRAAPRDFGSGARGNGGADRRLGFYDLVEQHRRR